MLLPFQAEIWFYQFPVDFRRQIDGLVILVADHLQKDPASGQLFIFRNKQADKIKLLWFDKWGSPWLTTQFLQNRLAY